MQLSRNLYKLFCKQAAGTHVTSVIIGLRYTAVTTDDGGIGIAFTDVGAGNCCGMGKDYSDFEGRPALELLTCLQETESLRRSMALALVNALNYSKAVLMPEDAANEAWMDALGIGDGSHVAMVGFFRPLMPGFKARKAEVEILDDGQSIGDRESFYRKLENWAEVLLLTSTSIINNTTEEVLKHLNPGAKAVMLGPSTPMVPQAFTHLPVRLLAGTLPMAHESVLKAIRHGQGTPVIHRFSRKICCSLPSEP